MNGELYCGHVEVTDKNSREACESEAEDTGLQLKPTFLFRDEDLNATSSVQHPLHMEKEKNGPWFQFSYEGYRLLNHQAQKRQTLINSYRRPYEYYGFSYDQ
ncbi:2488_t:CDS:1 [Ambispora gerdemannii]|uniref:2488_t:CDS:1 n=1 Tax=Ambispora gerdemannii TaxID=144530 RepID=A0A9N9G6V2_9GLOM|nr:2488_t:CDS:1 [Ambispora gerdemannii]